MFHIFRRPGQIVVPRHRGNPGTQEPYAFANTECGKDVRYSNTVSTRGNLAHVDLCSDCLRALETQS